MSEKCRKCGAARGSVMSRTKRIEFLRRIDASVRLWMLTSATTRGYDDEVCSQLARSSALVELLLADELEVCDACLEVVRG